MGGNILVHRKDEQAMHGTAWESKCVQEVKESARDRRKFLKARGFALTHLVTFQPFCSYFSKTKQIHLSAQASISRPSLSHWEMGWNKRVMLWLARQIFPFLPYPPSCSVLWREVIVKTTTIWQDWAASLWPGSANGCDDLQLLLTTARCLNTCGQF